MTNVKCVQIAEEVHHLTFENFSNEEVDDLQFLCSNCHSEITFKERIERINQKRVERKVT